MVHDDDDEEDSDGESEGDHRGNNDKEEEDHFDAAEVSQLIRLRWNSRADSRSAERTRNQNR